MRINKNVVITVWSLISVLSLWIGWKYWRERELEGQGHIIRYGARQYSVEAMDRSARNRDKTLAVAKKLRAKWEKWARDHQDVINRLPGVDTNDQVAVLEIYNALPKTGYAPDGVQWRDLGGIRSVHELSKPGVVQFTWNAGLKPKLDGPEQPNQWTRQQVQMHGDYPLATSMSMGRNQIYLWASGKITEEILDDRKNPKKGESFFAEPRSVVLVQPYDFFKGRN